MPVAYLDTSAAMKLAVAEPGSDELITMLGNPLRRVVSSWLLHAELHCAAGRRPEDISADRVRAILDRVVLVDLVRGDLIAAGTLAPLRSQDAVHLAVAIRLGVDEVITYDRELTDAVVRTGMTAMAPGAASPR